MIGGPLKWATNGTYVEEPVDAKKLTGAVPGRPEAAEHYNFVTNGVAEGVNFDRNEGCLLHMPLRNSLDMLIGSGVVNYSRASIANYVDMHNVLQSAVVDEPRYETNGYLNEGASTNLSLHSRDLTDVAWVKVNCTALKDAIGWDGVASSASTLTATGASATILQTIVAASLERVYSVALKRKTGTGTIEITMDNGITWVDVTSTLDTTWQKYQVTQTLANNVFGIRVTTSGDEVEVDVNQIEARTYASSAIHTTTVAVTRAKDILNLEDAILSYTDTNNFGAYILTLTPQGFLTGGTQSAILIQGSVPALRVYSSAGVHFAAWGASAVTSSPGPTPAVATRLGLLHTIDDSTYLFKDGVQIGAAATNSPATLPISVIEIGNLGGANSFYGNISDIRIYDKDISLAAMMIA